MAFLEENLQVATRTPQTWKSCLVIYQPVYSEGEQDGVLLNFKLSELVKTLGQFFRKKYKEVSAEFYIKTK